MAKAYTSGKWMVKEGQEEEFVKRWQEFIEQSAKKAAGAGEFQLLQANDNRQHFMSVGSWDNQQAADDWRLTDNFKHYIAKCRELCDSFEPADFGLKLEL